MFSYSLRFRKNTECKNPIVVRTKNRRIMLLSKCSVCNSKKSKFLKEQEAKALWDNFNMKEMPGIVWT